MKLWTQPLGPLQTNGFVISNDQREGIVIDPGMEPEEMLDEIKDLEIKGILLTHAHFDHMAGLNQVLEQTGAPVYIHQLEREWLKNSDLNGSSRWPMVTKPIACDAEPLLLNEGEKMNLAGFDFTVLHTPGHSPGSVSFHFKQNSMVIAGDTLFAGSIGRTDLHGGDYDQLISSIRTKLLSLPEDTVVYPGHGPQTTIKTEKRFNPYVGSL